MQFVRMLAAVAPVAVLLGGVVGLQWRVYRAAALAWLVAVGGALTLFGAGPALLAAASAKGLSLALLVMLIVWAAVFLYSIMHEMGAMQVLADGVIERAPDPSGLPLLVGWACAGFVQGIAGFGVPITILTPLLLLAGLSPTRAVAVAMIGPTWAITFGSMGSSFFAIRLVVGLDDGVLGPALALLSWLPIFLSGLSVAHIAAGWHGVRRLWAVVLLASTAMTAVMWIVASVGAAPLASMLSGLVGALVVWTAGHLTSRRGLSRPVRPAGGLTLAGAMLPYAMLTLLSIAAQLPAVKQATQGWRFALSYPSQASSLGFSVASSTAYAPIQLIGHPAPLLLISALISFQVFKQRGVWKTGTIGRAWRSTVRQTTGTTVGVSLMVMMALVVTDSGMAATLAASAALLGETIYPVMSPFIGMLGAFVTGSSTNSNVMFGPLQLYASRALAINTVLVAAAQTIGGAVGSGVAPDKAMIGRSVVGPSVQEGEAIRRALPYALAIVLVIGLETLIAGVVLGS